jgi:hypothetical protein
MGIEGWRRKAQVEANNTGGQDSRRAVVPSDDIYIYIYITIMCYALSLFLDSLFPKNRDTMYARCLETGEDTLI